ncbi:Fur family transcriptional regulator [Candidatus Omnitrophota bacterium]
MEEPKSIFKEFCKKNNMRYTPERGIIIDEIYKEDTHFDIDELFLRIRNSYPNIRLAKGSIYRTLPHLKNAGLIRESLNENGHSCYEHTLGHTHHDHMKCIGCGKIFDFYEKEIDQLQNTICKKRGFKMVWHTHVIGGYCKKCQKNNRINQR